jgi:hypothetical protein
MSIFVEAVGSLDGGKAEGFGMDFWSDTLPGVMGGKPMDAVMTICKFLHMSEITCKKD